MILLRFRSCVRVVKCNRSGMGKSLYIQRLAEDLKERLEQTEVSCVTIPLHGPVITPDTVLELFQNHFKKPSCYIYHIDIAPSVSMFVYIITPYTTGYCIGLLYMIHSDCSSMGRESLF